MSKSYSAVLYLCLLLASSAEEVLADADQPNGQPMKGGLDLSSYNCIINKEIKNSNVRHLGQFIAGQYREWYQLHGDKNDGDSLLCINLVKPTVRALSKSEAATFLSDTNNVGLPLRRERENSTTKKTNTNHDYVPAEPLPRPIYTEKSLADPNTSPPSTPEQPPFPAERAYPDSSGEDIEVGPEKRNPSSQELGGSFSDDKWRARERDLTVGVEDRTRVKNPDTFPYNTIGYLVSTYPNDESFRCTGTLVSPYVVLTAGHCVHNNDRGGWAVKVIFYPAQNQINATSPTIRPYGGKSDTAWIRSFKDWTDISGPNSRPIIDFRYDLAAIQFRTPFTYTDTFLPIEYGNTSSANNTGYPAKVLGISNNLAMWSDFGDETSTSITAYRDSHIRGFLIDASGGNSGGPFWAYYSSTEQRVFHGILSWGDDLDDEAGGPWFDSWNQGILSSWVTWTPESDNQRDTSPPSLSGLRVGGVFGSSQTLGQSFIRLFNPTTQSGRVEVTISDAGGEPLTTWTSPTIPAYAVKQFSISDIEGEASTPITPQAYYSLSLRPNFDGRFQHVLWRSSDGSLTNLTGCNTDVTSDPGLLFGVHTSTLDYGYPSRLVIHNTEQNAKAVSLGIYDARNGDKLGTYVSPVILSNALFIHYLSGIESEATPPISPTSSMYHYVVKVNSNFEGTVQHLMSNKSSGVVTDLGTFCNMNAAPQLMPVSVGGNT